MAIVCSNVNELSVLAHEMHEITSVQGSNLLKNYETVFNSLKSHWKGSDANKNLNDLKLVYGELALLVTKLDNLVMDVNNLEVMPLLAHVRALGGDCVSGETISGSLNVTMELAFEPSGAEIYTDPALVQDAASFESVPTDFARFVSELNEKYERLRNNWTEGAGIEEIRTVFTKFNDSVGTYTEQLNIVKENLNTVAMLKQNMMN